jgi:CheY-like chemotaxis protein
MLKCLVIDSSPFARPLIKSTLVNCRVSWATSGEQGLNKAAGALLKQRPFDFVLLDSALRQPSLPRIIAELRKLEQSFEITRPAALILMSSSGLLTLEADPLMPKLAGFLCRPFQRADIERCLVRAGLRSSMPENVPLAIDRGDLQSPDDSSGELLLPA